ncbi:unnamed protein product [Lampetra fluviatilis]
MEADAHPYDAHTRIPTAPTVTPRSHLLCNARAAGHEMPARLRELAGQTFRSQTQTRVLVGPRGAWGEGERELHVPPGQHRSRSPVHVLGEGDVGTADGRTGTDATEPPGVLRRQRFCEGLDVTVGHSVSRLSVSITSFSHGAFSRGPFNRRASMAVAPRVQSA